MIEAAAEKFFPIMFGNYSTRDEILSLRKAGCYFCVVCIPWDMIAPHEKQATANHGQTLKRLAERGGLAASEAIAVLEDRRWRQMTAADANEQLAAMVARRQERGEA